MTQMGEGSKRTEVRRVALNGWQVALSKGGELHLGELLTGLGWTAADARAAIADWNGERFKLLLAASETKLPAVCWCTDLSSVKLPSPGIGPARHMTPQRAALCLATAEPPTAQHVAFARCRNAKCCRPSHLLWVEQSTLQKAISRPAHRCGPGLKNIDWELVVQELELKAVLP